MTKRRRKALLKKRKKEQDINKIINRANRYSSHLYKHIVDSIGTEQAKNPSEVCRYISTKVLAYIAQFPDSWLYQAAQQELIERTILSRE